MQESTQKQKYNNFPGLEPPELCWKKINFHGLHIANKIVLASLLANKQCNWMI